MKILFVASRFHTNQGPFVRAMVAAGHEVLFDVLSVGTNEDHSEVRPNRMPIAWLPGLLMRWRRPVNPIAYLADRAYPSIFWYLKRFRSLTPDVVVVRDPYRPYAWRAAVAARLLGIRVVLYTQGDVYRQPSRRDRVLRASLIAAFDAVWFSPVSGDRGLPRAHSDVHYLPFAADLAREIKTTWFVGNRVNLLGIGKFTERKNHLLLLEAFDLLRRTHAVHLTLVGEVSTEEHRLHLAKVRDQIRLRELSDQVTVMTNIPFTVLPQLFVKHDLFVLASRNESASVSILEAMAHGLPVICSTTSGTRWYVEPSRSGLIFESDDLPDLVETLASAVESREDLVNMGREGRRLAETVHAPGVVAQAFVQMLDQWRRTT